MGVRETWPELFTQASKSALYGQIRAARLPESDWASCSPEKVDDFLKSVLAAFMLLEDGKPFSTVETGVFAGGTSGVFLHVLGSRFADRSIHVGIDPYFAPEQSYPALAEVYGSEPYLIGLKQLSEIALRVHVPYVPYLMSSETFIRKDVLPDTDDFRVFHLDGDHSASAVLRELEYFSSKVKRSAVFILDDIGETFPGVLEAATRFQESHPCFMELSEFRYDTRSGDIGFGVYYVGGTE